jgi:hypothetical protein
MRQSSPDTNFFCFSTSVYSLKIGNNLTDNFTVYRDKEHKIVSTVLRATYGIFTHFSKFLIYLIELFQLIEFFG